MNEVFAAPASGLPFLSTAFASQLAAIGVAADLLVDDAAGACANAAAEKMIPAIARINLFIAISLLK
jgi:hypothetical protein